MTILIYQRMLYDNVINVHANSVQGSSYVNVYDMSLHDLNTSHEYQTSMTLSQTNEVSHLSSIMSSSNLRSTTHDSQAG